MFIRRDKGEISSEEQAPLPSPSLMSSHTLPPNHRWLLKMNGISIHRGRSRINMKFEVPSFPVLRGTSPKRKTYFGQSPFIFSTACPPNCHHPSILKKTLSTSRIPTSKKKNSSRLREKNECSTHTLN